MSKYVPAAVASAAVASAVVASAAVADEGHHDDEMNWILCMTREKDFELDPCLESMFLGLKMLTSSFSPFRIE